MSSGASLLARQGAVVPVKTISLTTKTCSHKAGAIRMRGSVDREGFDGTQESQDSSAQKSGLEARCFKGEVKRVVQRVVRVVKGWDQTMV